MTPSKSLFSTHWHRVASLRPRIEPGVTIQRQVMRMQEWFLFTHPVSGRHHRLNRNAYELVGRFDGIQTIDALWNGMQEKFGDEAPTQDEAIATLGQLNEAGLILFDVTPDWAKMQQVHEKRRVSERNAALNPFAFKVKLFDPSDVLERLRFLQTALCSPIAIMLWIVLVCWGLTRLVADWDAIWAYAAVHLLTPRCLLLAWFVYPVMKALHELGHAFAVRHWGGEVKEAGVSFFLLVPAPYVDASDATGFTDKSRRIIVSLAGIAVELALAAIALLVWASVESGLVRDLALVVMAIGGVSTIVFNGNPLMRFDGYYVLCDLLELPNLASRSQRMWAYLGQRHILGKQDAPPPRGDGRERIWLLIYGPLSWTYRVFVSIVIVQWVVAKSIFLGLLATIWMVFLLFIRPLVNAFRILVKPSHPTERRAQPLIRAGAIALALLAAFIWAPIPDSTIAAGLVWLPDQSQVRAKGDGEVIEVLVRNGQSVAKGQPLLLMRDTALLAAKKRLNAKISAQETEQLGALLTESGRSRNAGHQLDRLRDDFSQLEERQGELTVRADADGTFVLPDGNDLSGRYLPKGALIGYVVANGVTTVRAVVTQNDEGRIRDGIKSVSVRLAESPGQQFEAKMFRETPAATNKLPSVALGDRVGGEFVTDPVDQSGLSTLEPVFLVDVQVPSRELLRLGGRAWVRFEHPAKPLAASVVWRFRQLFLKLFSAEN
ncbi:MAG TPA: biotin/lipoyl-binding protein [Burkholderiales bacterium]|nr:biotin/lipoyl-binding protein [Burkholderiales bacterium]